MLDDFPGGEGGSGVTGVVATQHLDPSSKLDKAYKVRYICGMNLTTTRQTVRYAFKLAVSSAAAVLFLNPLHLLNPSPVRADGLEPNLTINYLSATDATNVWADSTPASIGETVGFYIEIHNTNEPSTAEDLTVRVDLVLESTAYAGASNHPDVSDSTSITGLPENAFLQYRSGSMRITWDQDGDGIKEFDNYAWPNDALVSETGINLGNLLGCNPYVIQISFKADVSEIPEELGTPQVSINKKIVWSGSEYDTISRETHLFDPDESIVYKIYVTNNGDAEATGVKVTDHLPAYIRVLDGADEKTFSIGTLGAGQTWAMTYTAKVLSDLPQNDRTQVNTARVTADNADPDEDSAHIWINGPEILAETVAAAVSAAPAPEAPAELPATGPAVPVALGFSGLLSVGFYLHKKLL